MSISKLWISLFTEKEKEYIKSQRLARMATVSSGSTSDIASNQPDVVPLLKHNLDEEIDMQNWCMNNLPKAVDKLLPTIISAFSK